MKKFILFCLFSLISMDCFAGDYDPTAIHDRGKQKIIGDLEIRAPTKPGAALGTGKLTAAAIKTTGTAEFSAKIKIPIGKQVTKITVSGNTTITSSSALISALNSWIGISIWKPLPTTPPNSIQNFTVYALDEATGTAPLCSTLNSSPNKPWSDTSGTTITCINSVNVAMDYSREFCMNADDVGELFFLSSGTPTSTVSSVYACGIDGGPNPPVLTIMMLGEF